MSTRAKHAATTPIPVQLSAPEFHEFILRHLSRPKRAFQEQRSKNIRSRVQFAGHFSGVRPPWMSEVLGVVPRIRWQPEGMA
jgi:hypothetical protein